MNEKTGITEWVRGDTEFNADRSHTPLSKHFAEHNVLINPLEVNVKFTTPQLGYSVFLSQNMNPQLVYSYSAQDWVHIQPG